MDMISKIKEAEIFAEKLKNETAEKYKNILTSARKAAESQYEATIKQAEKESIEMKLNAQKECEKQEKLFLMNMKKYDDKISISAKDNQHAAVEFILNNIFDMSNP